MATEPLAINGGQPVLDLGPIPWPVTTTPIREAIETALHENSWGQYEGRWTEALSEKLMAEFDSPHTMLCSSGTIAVELGLRGVGVRSGDEVILAGYDFPGNFRAIEAIGATPVLIDVVENGWVLDANQLESAISDRTAAVIVSHLHGQTADINSIRTILETHLADTDRRIYLLEDACQTPGGQLSGRPLGSFGDVTALSFGGSKLLSAGRGGALLTHDDGILQRAKIYAHRGNDAFPLSQLQSAVLVPQLDALPEMTRCRNEQAQWLIDQTRSIETLSGLQQIVPETLPAFFKLPWLLKDDPSGWTRTDFTRALQSEGLPIGEGFRGFLRRSPRRCRKIGTLANCRIAAQQTIILHHPILLKDQSTMEAIVEAFKKVIANP